MALEPRWTSWPIGQLPSIVGVGLDPAMWMPLAGGTPWNLNLPTFVAQCEWEVKLRRKRQTNHPSIGIRRSAGLIQHFRYQSQPLETCQVLVLPPRRGGWYKGQTPGFLKWDSSWHFYTGFDVFCLIINHLFTLAFSVFSLEFLHRRQGIRPNRQPQTADLVVLLPTPLPPEYESI